MFTELFHMSGLKASSLGLKSPCCGQGSPLLLHPRSSWSCSGIHHSQVQEGSQNLLVPCFVEAALGHVGPVRALGSVVFVESKMKLRLVYLEMLGPPAKENHSCGFSRRELASSRVPGRTGIFEGEVINRGFQELADCMSVQGRQQAQECYGLLTASWKASPGVTFDSLLWKIGRPG